MKIYQYAILYKPKDETKKAAILVPIKEILAQGDKEAMIIAARSIPEEYIDKLDEVEVAVRPF